ncbi:MAG TPA: hypothetical protein VGS12_10995 [Caulobacteraceae bacterium]|nr:hypothetical protein [Caulobacteraceae bacterium]
MTIPPLTTGIPYIESDASLEVPPPYHFPGVTVHAFVWEAQMAPIQAYCDRFFNLGTAQERGFVYRAAAFWPYAMLLLLDYPEMIASSRRWTVAAHYGNQGILRQREVFVAVPVVRYGLGARRLAADTDLEFALPVIVVDDPNSAICGREMLGLGKMVAEIELGTAEYPDSFAGKVRLPGWATMAPNEVQSVLPFLEVTTAPALPTFRGSADVLSPWTLLQSREGGWLMSGLTSLADFTEQVSAGIVPTAMRTVQLKQFRDAAHPERAVYQSLVTCRSYYANIRGFSFFNEKDVDIAFHDVGSFAGILRVFLDLPGSESEPTGKTVGPTPVAGFTFTADVDFDNMRTLHTFPVDRGPGVAPVPQSSDLAAQWLRPWRGLFAKAPAP